MRPHTTGPWTLTHVAGDNFAVQRFELRGMLFDTPNTYPIFQRDLTAIDGATFCASPEDARLIAAAPDMLDALADAERAIASLEPDDFGGIFDCHGELVGTVRDQLLDKVRAALAKARGPRETSAE